MDKRKVNLYFKEIFSEFILAILAGICISLGSLAYLSSPNAVVGALFFTVGLFMVLFFDFNLFTGRICFSLEKKPSYIINLIVIWLGNLAGALSTGYLLRLTRLETLFEKCNSICQTKLNDGLHSLFILAIFCNILIFVAVYGYKKADEGWKKCLALFFGVSVFVLCGFEHCVADMFYLSFANVWSWSALGRILLITLGNIIGGLVIPLLLKLITLLRKKPENVEHKVD